MDNSINNSKAQKYTKTKMETQICPNNFDDTQSDQPTLSMISENIWKNTPGIQALFIINSTKSILYSKYSKYFNNIDPKQIEKIISTSCSSFGLTSKLNPMKISIGVFEKFTSMTSQIEEQFLVMIVPNNTSVNHSISFAKTLSSTC